MIKKNKLLFLMYAVVILALILVVIYFTFFHASKSNVDKALKSVTQLQARAVFKPSLLDTRFLTIYGKITGVGTSSIDVQVINSTSTDYIFFDIKHINVSVETSTIIKKYSEATDIYKNIKLSDIKINNTISVYIKNASSTTSYEAIGIKVLSDM